ncbi:hypothetical protein OROHE_018447 [Orobanche hederae]
MEARLKDDILREAARYQGAIMVIHETDEGQISDAWEHADGFPIKYARVPITDGKVPKGSDFDTLSKNIVSASKDTAFIFNSQMGIGRTTTGTVITCLLKLRIDQGRPIRAFVDDSSQTELRSHSAYKREDHISTSTPSPDKIRSRKDWGHSFGINDILLLWKITKLFENGVECRVALDSIVDWCSALQNIRQAVLQFRQLFNPGLPKSRNAPIRGTKMDTGYVSVPGTRYGRV